MRSIILFCEDNGHESFLMALLRRLSRDYGIPVDLKPRSVRGGRAKVIEEIRQFLRDMELYVEHLPDLFLVATDANCIGYSARRDEVLSVAEGMEPFFCLAIPDPHIERWMLIDSAAFKKVTERGCKAPRQKCMRDLYKRLLEDAFREAGISPLLGGFEYAEDYVNAMKLVPGQDKSFNRLLAELRKRFSNWAHEGS